MEIDSYAGTLALCLAHAIVIDDIPEVTFLKDSLTFVMFQTDILSSGYLESHSVPQFVRLLTAFRENSCNLAQNFKQNNKCYQKVASSWGDVIRLADAVRQCCDFHCDNISESKSDSVAEFQGPPYDLIPIEIMALYSVRSHFGLSNPVVNHPLLLGVIESVRLCPVDIDDDIIDRISIEI